MKKIYILLMMMSFGLLSYAQTKTYCDSISAAYYTSVSGTKVTFTLKSTVKPVSVEWIFGDGTSSTDVNPTKDYLKAGTFQPCVYLKFKNIRDTTKPCVKKLCYSVTTTSPCNSFNPTAGFKVDSTGKATFDAAAAPSKSKYYYSWDFGDGTSGSSKSGTHQYKAGSYKACVTIKDSATKCTKTHCFTFTVPGSDPCKNYNPGAGFKVDSTGLAFFEAAASNSTAKYSYFWDFGDNTTSTDRTGKHQYKAGTYKACVTIKDSVTKCSKTICFTFTVSGSDPCSKFNPTANITVDSTGLAVFEAKFDSNYTYKWSFGDSTFSSDRVGKHQYKAGTYNACVTIYDKKTRCSKTLCKTIVVGTNPCTNFNPKIEFKVDSSGKAYFWGVSTNPSGLSYTWTYGDGTSGTGQQVTHTYKAGSWKFCVKIVDPKTNCYKHICETITVKGTDPCKNFNPDFGFRVDGTVVLFEAASGDKYTYSWTFSNSSTSTDRTVKIDFKKPGTYKACVKITDTKTGCYKTICKEVVIKAKNTSDPCKNFNPKVSFQISNGTVYLGADGGKGATFEWNFGDGSKGSTSRTPVHTYAKSGKYTICVTVYDAKRSCKKTICFTIEVSVPSTNPCEKFNPDFGYTITKGKVVVEGNTKGLVYQWAWGDKTTGSGKVADHTYKGTGKYTICMTAYDSVNRCKKTVCKTISISHLMIGGADNGENDMIVYPNPAENYVTVVTPSDSKASITVRNATGADVIRYDATPNEDHSIEMLVESLPKGLYYISVEQDGKIEISKFYK